MRKTFITFFFTLIASAQSYLFAQKNTASHITGDLIMGPYLFISHIPYDAVMMSGARLSYSITNSVTIAAAYMVGQQQDDQNTLGLTHHAGIEIGAFLAPPDRIVRPYFMLGTGFFEFKSFSKDKYGIASQCALGAEFKISEKLSALLEPRYLNLGQMNLGGVHQLVICWGLRVTFGQTN